MSKSTETADKPIDYEAMYAEQPDQYRTRVRRWMWLGYGYVIAIIGAIAALVFGGGYLVAAGHVPLYLVDNMLKLGLPAVLLCLVMAKGFFVRIPPPDGKRLTGELKKKVINHFEALRAECDGPRLNEVYIDTELNAAVQQTRAFGIVGPFRNYLILGAPLLEIASADEIRSIVAHEFGHLSHAHGKLGAAVYRLNATLSNSAKAIEEKSASGVDGVAFKFFRWFIPKFNELTFAMRRGQEYEADRVAANATSAKTIASALCRLNAVDGAIDKFWEDQWHHAENAPSNSELSPFNSIREQVYRNQTEEATTVALDQAMKEQTESFDTHPALKERLGAIGAEPGLVKLSSLSALESMVGVDGHEEILQIANQLWRKNSENNWIEAHKQHQQAKSELRAMQEEAAGLKNDELLRLGLLEERYGEQEAANRIFARAANENISSAAALYHHGRTLLASDFVAGQENLVSAAKLDSDYLPTVVDHVYETLKQREMQTELESLDSLIEEYNNKNKLAREERDSASIEDDFRALKLSSEKQDQLIEILIARPGVKSLRLIEKQVEHYPESAMFLAVVEIHYFSDDIDADQERWLASFIDELDAIFDDSVTVLGVIASEENEIWKERADEFEGALVYEKAKKSLGQRLIGTGRWIGVAFFKWLATVIVIIICVLFAVYMGWMELPSTKTTGG